jgi:hypothetical protein
MRQTVESEYERRMRENSNLFSSIQNARVIEVSAQQVSLLSRPYVVIYSDGRIEMGDSNQDKIDAILERVKDLILPIKYPEL